jgi:hypothetical protein
MRDALKPGRLANLDWKKEETIRHGDRSAAVEIRFSEE